MEAPIKPEWLADMTVLSIAPGDVLVLRSKHPLTTQAIGHLRESVRFLEERVGFPVSALVLEEDMGIGVMRPVQVRES